MCQSQEDAIMLRQLLAKSAMIEGKSFIVQKHARDALDVLRPEHDPIIAGCLRSIHAVHLAADGNYNMATQEFLNLALPEEPELEAKLQSELHQICTQRDLSLYFLLCAIASNNKRDLRQQILQAVSFSQTVESASDLSSIIEDFCNGNYR